MSKIIGVTVGTTTNPNKFGAPTDEQIEKAVNKYLEENPSGGVTDYNDLTNKPITYLGGQFVDLDKITDNGFYIVDSFKCTLMNGDVERYQYPALIHNIDGIQIIELVLGFILRMYNDGEWQGMNRYYELEKKFIFPISGSETDGIVTYDLSSYEIPHNPYRSVTISQDCTFYIPEHTYMNTGTGECYANKSYLIYANFTEEVSIDWGSDVIFYNNEIPEIGVGLYEIIFTFDPNAEKWCVGVLSKGAVE